MPHTLEMVSGLREPSNGIFQAWESKRSSGNGRKLSVTRIDDRSNNVRWTRDLGDAGKDKRDRVKKLEKRPKIVVTPIPDKTESELHKSAQSSS
jgi:hypothetical protein